MKIILKIVIGFLVGIVFSIGVPLIILALGVPDFGADAKPTWLERTLAPWALDHSIERRTLHQADSFDGQPAAIAEGLRHYRENCVVCHAAPGLQQSEIAMGMNPPPPNLAGDTQEMPDGELFWYIKHGVRMTGMPAFGLTHSDEQIWKIVAFVRHLPHLTDAEKLALHAKPEAGQEQAETKSDTISQTISKPTSITNQPPATNQ